MTVELAVIISIAAFLSNLIFSISGWKRSEKHDTKSDSAQLTTVIVKLENITMGISEIKADMNNMKTDTKELRERLVKVEASASSAHKRLDGMETWKNNEN
ncbi:MAG: hypothetical protein RSB98_02825 [Raoultibacter sp.]